MGLAKWRWRRFPARWKRLAEPLFLWAGVILLCIAAVFWAQESWRAHHAVRSMATVTENEARMDAQGQVTYFTHFRFRDGAGQVIQAVSAVGSNPADFAAGEQVPVLYPAGEPAEAEIATTGRVYVWAIGLGLPGTLLFDAGVLLWVLRRWRASPVESGQNA